MAGKTLLAVLFSITLVGAGVAQAQDQITLIDTSFSAGSGTSYFPSGATAGDLSTGHLHMKLVVASMAGNAEATCRMSLVQAGGGGATGYPVSFTVASTVEWTQTLASMDGYASIDWTQPLTYVGVTFSGASQPMAVSFSAVLVAPGASLQGVTRVAQDLFGIPFVDQTFVDGEGASPEFDPTDASGPGGLGGVAQTAPLTDFTNATGCPECTTNPPTTISGTNDQGVFVGAPDGNAGSGPSLGEGDNGDHEVNNCGATGMETFLVLGLLAFFRRKA